MGKLTEFNLSDLNCNVYVETGIGLCDSFRYATTQFDEAACYGIDIENDFIENARSKFPQSHLFTGLSTDGLKKWFQEGCFQPEDRILFFLDAHFPGSDYRNQPYDVHAPHALPLREELSIIKHYRPNNHDTIICDDARIYYHGSWANGNTIYRADHMIEDIFCDRQITLDSRSEGYIIITKVDTARSIE